jgi:hypothetical protein
VITAVETIIINPITTPGTQTIFADVLLVYKWRIAGGSCGAGSLTDVAAILRSRELQGCAVIVFVLLVLKAP